MNRGRTKRGHKVHDVVPSWFSPGDYSLRCDQSGAKPADEMIETTEHVDCGRCLRMRRAERS